MNLDPLPGPAEHHDWHPTKGTLPGFYIRGGKTWVIACCLNRRWLLLTRDATRDKMNRAG